MKKNVAPPSGYVLCMKQPTVTVLLHIYSVTSIIAFGNTYETCDIPTGSKH